MCDRCLFRDSLLTTECARCVRTRESFVERFEEEFFYARQEYVRLGNLFRDVCWYNFETECRKWNAPWRPSDPDSFVHLFAHRYKLQWNRRHLRESACFPCYYTGPVSDAPPLPPQIVLAELEQAKQYMEACRSQTSAPIDWAPGGAKYEALRRTTKVGKTFCCETEER